MNQTQNLNIYIFYYANFIFKDVNIAVKAKSLSIFYFLVGYPNNKEQIFVPIKNDLFCVQWKNEKIRNPIQFYEKNKLNLVSMQFFLLYTNELEQSEKCFMFLFAIL